MKWSTLKLFTILFLIGSCTGKSEEEKLRLRVSNLESELSRRDSSYNSIMELMVTVENQIEDIKEREYAIDLNKEGNLSASRQDQIIKDFQSLDGLILESRKTIRNLSSKLDESDIVMESFKLKVSQLNQAVEDRGVAIVGLRKALQARNLRIMEMSDEMMELETEVAKQEEELENTKEIIAEQELELMTVYYISGTEDELEMKQVISKEGGFIGLGQTLVLESELDKSVFTPLNKLETTLITIPGNEYSIITEHPSTSYEIVSLEDKNTGIRILNADGFWELSNFLVVSQDD